MLGPSRYYDRICSQLNFCVDSYVIIRDIHSLRHTLIFLHFLYMYVYPRGKICQIKINFARYLLEISLTICQPRQHDGEFVAITEQDLSFRKRLNAFECNVR